MQNMDLKAVHPLLFIKILILLTQKLLQLYPHKNASSLTAMCLHFVSLCVLNLEGPDAEGETFK